MANHHSQVFENKGPKRRAMLDRIWCRTDDAGAIAIPSQGGKSNTAKGESEVGNRPVPAGAHISAGVETDPRRTAPIRTDAEAAQQEPSQIIEQDRVPFLVGAIRSPKEHAVELLKELRVLGLEGRAVYQGDLHVIYLQMCMELDWCPRGWNAIGRELKKLPGVCTGKIWGPHRARLTFYEIDEPEETSAPASSPTKPKSRVA